MKDEPSPVKADLVHFDTLDDDRRKAHDTLNTP